MKKLSNQTKIIIILIINFIIITSVFTYQDYQKEKKELSYQSPIKLVTDAINDDFSLLNINSKHTIDYNIARYPDTNFIIYDSHQYPYLPNSSNFYFSIVDKSDEQYELEDKIFFNNVNYLNLKKISEYIFDAFNNGNTNPIITFNYDYILDYFTYLKIDDTVFINGDIGYIQEATTAPITKLVTHFIDYENISQQEPYCHAKNLEVYEYLESFFENSIKENITEFDEFKKEGLYQVINPDDSPIGKIDYVDPQTKEREFINVRYCFQELSAEYGRFYDKNIDIYNEPYYIVWVQYDEPHKDYTFLTYLSTHYYNYILLIILCAISYFIIKKIIIKKVSDEKVELITIKEIEEDEIKPEEIAAKEEINLNEIINNLIIQSNNLLKFKHLTIDYHASDAIIQGDKDDINFVVNKFYNFMIHYAKPNDTLIIKIENHNLSFSYAKAKIEHLDELNDCVEIIKKHKYIYAINRENISFKGWG